MSDRSAIHDSLRALLPNLPDEMIDAHLTGLEDAYLMEHSADAIARHLRLSATLAADRPVALDLAEVAQGALELTAVAFDYFGEFAVLCGVLAAHGLDIHSGHVFTCRPPQPERDRGTQHTRRGPVPSWQAPRIVDTFIVSPQVGESFGDAEREALLQDLDATLRRVGAGALTEARDRVNRRLAERLDRMPGPASRVLYPVDVSFDAAPDAQWTVMDVRSQDTPAFLYALANALSMRGVYIHRVEIHSSEREVHDRFFIADRLGSRIDDAKSRDALKTTVGLIKQFTHFLPSAPDPATAIRHFDQLVDKVLESTPPNDAGAPILDHLDELAHLLGSSRFLWEDFLRMQWENITPVLSDRALARTWDRDSLEKDFSRALGTAPSFEERRQAINAFKDRALFLIDLQQIQSPSFSLTEFSSALTMLAETVLAGALELCSTELRRDHGWPKSSIGEDVGFGIFGLGKFGGAELGYASDIELLFVYGPEGTSEGVEQLEAGAFFDKLVRSLVGVIEARQHGIFEIDMRLRPYGRKGPLASSLEQMGAYYKPGGAAAPFERQALTKLRGVCGAPRILKSVEEIRERFVYGPEPWDRDGALHLRWRQSHELVRAGTTNVKYSPGGLIDIEYSAQYLQVQHGHAWPEVRSPNTLTALEALTQRGALEPKDLHALKGAYLLLRRVIDGLRMVRGDAKDLVLPPVESEEFAFLARRLGRRGATWEAAARELASDIEQRMRDAREFYVRAFGEPQRAS